MALTRIAVGAEVRGEVAHRRLERGLGDAHHVVVGDDLLGAVVGQRQDRAAAAEVAAAPRGRARRASRRDTSRASAKPSREVSTKRAVEVLALGVGERVDEDVELAAAPAQRLEDGRICSSDWTSQGSTNVGADRVGERPDPALDEALDRREADRRRPRRGTPSRCPRRSSGRSRPRRRAPCCPSSRPIACSSFGTLRMHARPATLPRRHRLAVVQRCTGIRGLLLDLDGVLVLGRAAPSRARVEAIAELERRGDPVPGRDQHVARLAWTLAPVGRAAWASRRRPTGSSRRSRRRRPSSAREYGGSARVRDRLGRTPATEFDGLNVVDRAAESMRRRATIAAVIARRLARRADEAEPRSGVPPGEAAPR